MTDPAQPEAGGRWLALMPGTFVLLWSSGFIGAKFGLPYAEPATFLTLRFVMVIVLMLVIALLWRARWPDSPVQIVHIAVSGMLVHSGYLGGVFSSIHHGMSAGITALIVGMQPILTAIVGAPLLGERVSALQWLGFALGLAGVVLVVSQKATLAGFTPLGAGLAFMALVSITAGTLYQKRYCGSFDLRSGSVIQFAGATLALAPFAFLFETREIEWSGEFVFALLWLVFVLSIGAISLLTLLIRRGAVTKVASLMYLVPPVTAIMAWLMFRETLSAQAVAGLALAAIGVALVVRSR